MKLEAVNHRSTDFFKILPQDWQEIIKVIWDKVKVTSTIYAIVEKNSIIVGGIIFTDKLPEMTKFELEQGQPYFDLGYDYIGFLWVDEKRRNEQLGSKWLSLLKKNNIQQGFWLTVEEENLKNFYEKNGFTTIAQSEEIENMEWLCVYEPQTK